MLGLEQTDLFVQKEARYAEKVDALDPYVFFTDGEIVIVHMIHPWRALDVVARHQACVNRLIS